MGHLATLLARTKRDAPRSARMIAIAGAILVVTVGAPPAGAASAGAFVRVNQVGYETSSHAKRAYLMASAPEIGATFSVIDGTGATIYSAPIGDNLGSGAPPTLTCTPSTSTR